MLLPRRLTVGTVLLLYIFSAVISAATLPPVSGSTTSASASPGNPAIVPNTYIVQLKTVLKDPLSKANLEAHEDFHKKARRDGGMDYVTRQTFANTSLFVGLSLTLSSDDDLPTLKGLDSVVGVWPVQSVARPSAAIHSVPHTKRGRKPRSTVPGTNVTLPYITGETYVNNPHTMAKVDQVQAAGIKGKGMKIAIIDTGVDYRHPSLGGCFGSGCKIAFGYDFVGDNYPTTTKTSSTPLATCISGGHGTHVTGIIGMEDQPNTGFGLVGVAPEATLGMYRVFGCSGETSTDILISAMLQAAADGANVITMSLGSKLHSETPATDPFYTLTSTIVQQDVAVFAATGNDADYGAYWPSTPGSGPSVFAVGSVENSKFPTTYQLSDSNGQNLRYSAVLPLDGPAEGLELQVMNYGGTADELYGCRESYYEEAAANVTDPSKVILAIKNGICVSWSKGEVAALYGYRYLLLYTTENQIPDLVSYGDVNPEVDYDIAPIIINPADSMTILGSYSTQPGKYKIYFDERDYFAQSPDTLEGGFMSNYSSWGPTYELDLKPQLSAPGGQILSTWPLELNGGYAVISGTSMSTPFMAGCYALVKSQYSELSINETYALLMNSAGTQMPWFYDKSITSSAVQQGAGLVNVHNAVTWESLVTPPSLNLGTTNRTVAMWITIKNRSNRAKTYTLSHKPAGAVQNALDVTAVVNQQYDWYASATFDQDSLLIQGGQSVNVQVLITPPANVNSTLRPVYTGFIVVNNNDETYTIPYVGQPWSIGDGLIATNVPISSFPSLEAITATAPAVHAYAKYYSIMYWTNKADTTNQTFSMGQYGYPGVLWGVTQTVDYVRFDMVPANTSFIPDRYGYDPTVISIPPEDLIYPSNVTLTNIVGLDVVTVMEEYEGPISGSDGFWWKLPPKQPPNADYRIVMRVLRSGADYNLTSSWESWMSAILHIDTNAPFVPTYR